VRLPSTSLPPTINRPEIEPRLPTRPSVNPTFNPGILQQLAPGFLPQRQ
jgi:hypothetical protein